MKDYSEIKRFSKTYNEKFLPTNTSITNLIPLQIEMIVVAAVASISFWYLPFEAATSIVTGSISLSKTCLYDARESPIANRNQAIQAKKYVKFLEDDLEAKKKMYKVVNNTALSILMIVTACASNYFFHSWCYISKNLASNEQAACNSSNIFLVFSVAASIVSIMKTCLWSYK